jgi:hypothetical protein
MKFLNVVPSQLDHVPGLPSNSTKSSNSCEVRLTYKYSTHALHERCASTRVQLTGFGDDITDLIDSYKRSQMYNSKD